MAETQRHDVIMAETQKHDVMMAETPQRCDIMMKGCDLETS